MPAAAMKTQPGPVAAPQPVEKTEIRAAPARPDRVPNATPSGAVGRPAAPVSSQIGMPRPAADPRAAPTAQLDPLASGPTQISAKTGNTGANVALRPAQRGTPDPWATAQSGLARAEEDPWLPRPSQIDLTPATPRIAPLDIDISESRPSAPGHTAIAPLLASEFDFTPAAPRPLIPSQAGVTPIEPRPIPEDATPYAPRPAMAETPPAQWAAPAVTAPNRPVPVVPPSFMDLPQIGARELTTQPGIAGPYTAQQPLQLTESPAATAIEDAPADQVLATPASLWRRTFASLFDFSLLGGVIGGLLFLAVGLVAGGKPMPNNLHGIDAFFFRLHPIAIPALGLTVLLAVLYTAMGAFLLRGRTFGRLLFGIRLVDSTGKSPGAVRSLVRAFFAIVSFVFFLAGFWLGLFDRKGQTLHDKLTRTFVVRPV